MLCDSLSLIEMRLDAYLSQVLHTKGIFGAPAASVGDLLRGCSACEGIGLCAARLVCYDCGVERRLVDFLLVHFALVAFLIL